MFYEQFVKSLNNLIPHVFLVIPIVEKKQQNTVTLEMEEYEAFLALIKAAVRLLEKQKQKRAPCRRGDNG